MHSHKTMIHALRLCAVASFGLASFNYAATAQTDKPSPRLPSETPRQPGETTRQPVDPKMPRDDASWNDRGTMLIPASWAIGKDIISSASDEKIGSVGDLLISPRHQRVTYVLISRGGVAGVGAKTYAVPFTSFTWNEDKKKLVLPVNKDQFDAAPALEGDDWKTLLNAERSTPLFEYYKVPADRREWRTDVSVPDMVGHETDGNAGRTDKPAPAKPAPSNQGRDDARGNARAGDEWNQQALNQWPLLKVSQIKGQTLLSDEGSELGTIKDVILDCTTGRIAFSSVSFGGVLGFGDKMVLIPWELFRVNAEGKVYATTLDPEMVKASPRVDHDDWRQLREENYAPGIYQHYNRDASWLERPSSDRVRTTRNDRFPDYDRLYSTGTTVDVSGLVMLVEQTRPMKDMPEVTSVAMTTDDKDTYVIHLAPDWYLKDQGLALKAGDRASFKGRWVTLDDKKYFVASQITPADGKVWVLRREDGTRSWTWR
ncbi:MAG: PRC-barrel domain-containing protein [Pyrinomonadaceae bacterium]|nr:PRC-barrel domain-containing protein [Phycisphaerales bacterium]